jgi:aspartate racemase
MAKTIGILGGMGPEATLDCFAKIIKLTPARKDQDHLRVVIDSNPKVPDRTEAIRGKGPSPVPLMVSGCKALERAGADFIIIPCVTAHFFIHLLKSEISLPIISIIDAVSESIEKDHREIKKIGLMGTTGTIEGGMFQKRLSRAGIITLLCGSTFQAMVMDAIYDIKNGSSPRSRDEIKKDLVSAAEHLIKKGAGGIIAGCTEIPLVLSQRDINVPFFYPVLILARAAVLICGMDPGRISQHDHAERSGSPGKSIDLAGS